MKIDVIIPTYYSKSLIKPLLVRLLEWKENTGLKPHFIFVDDGSLDGTLEELRKALPVSGLPYTLVGITQNVGQHNAIITGVRAGSNKIVATMDDDLQHDPFQIDLLVQTMKKEDADLVYGIYDDKKHHRIRNAGTRVLQLFLKWTTQVDYTDVTSFRVFKRKVLEGNLNSQEKIQFLEDYLISGSKKRSRVKVKHLVGLRDKSNYSFFQLVKMAMRIVIFHSSFPLKFITRLGLSISFICFALGLRYIYNKLSNDVELGFTSIIVSIFFSTGLILFSIGVVGEFLRRIWIQSQGLSVINSRIYESEN